MDVSRCCLDHSQWLFHLGGNSQGRTLKKFLNGELVYFYFFSLTFTRWRDCCLYEYCYIILVAALIAAYPQLGLSIMTSFRVIRESESAKNLRRRREQARYSNLRDTFHPTFPASAIEYIQRYGLPYNTHLSYRAGNPSDLSKLPSELIDLIFSKLSPAALAAARNTCRTWWTMIMSNAWVLGSVLGLQHPPAVSFDQPSENNKPFLRLLQKELDRQSTVYSDNMPPDILPLRFRRRDMNFSIPQVCKHVHQKNTTSRSRFVSADFTTSGRFMVLLITNSAVIAETSQQTHNVIFYQIAFSGEPLYVGTLQCSNSNGSLSIIGVIETQPNKSWSLTIDIAGQLRSYSIVTREAYAKTDAPFILKMQKIEIAPFTAAKETNSVNAQLKYFPECNKSWQVLTCINYDTVSIRETHCFSFINLKYVCKSNISIQGRVQRKNSKNCVSKAYTVRHSLGYQAQIFTQDAVFRR